MWTDRKMQPESNRAEQGRPLRYILGGGESTAMCLCLSVCLCYLNVATIANHMHKNGWITESRETGLWGSDSVNMWETRINTHSAASKMDFSWTWKENRKNARDEFTYYTKYKVNMMRNLSFIPRWVRSDMVMDKTQDDLQKGLEQTVWASC